MDKIVFTEIHLEAGVVFIRFKILKIIKMRLAIAPYSKSHTFKEISEEVKLTLERVRQLFYKGLKKILNTSLKDDVRFKNEFMDENLMVKNEGAWEINVENPEFKLKFNAPFLIHRIDINNKGTTNV